MSSSTLKNLFVWMAILLVAILSWNTLNATAAKPEEVDYTRFEQEVAQGNIAEVTITDGRTIEGAFKAPEGRTFETVLPFEADSEFIRRLNDQHGIVVTGEISSTNPLFAILITWAPVLLLVALVLLLVALVLLLVALWILFMRQMPPG